MLSRQGLYFGGETNWQKTLKIGITNFGPMNWFINFGIKFIKELILPIQLDKNEVKGGEK